MLSVMCKLRIVAGDVYERATRRLRPEEGASTVEWVIITGFLIVLAAVVGRLIYGLVQDAGTRLDVPTIP